MLDFAGYKRKKEIETEAEKIQICLVQGEMMDRLKETDFFEDMPENYYFIEYSDIEADTMIIISDKQDKKQLIEMMKEDPTIAVRGKKKDA